MTNCPYVGDLNLGGLSNCFTPINSRHTVSTTTISTPSTKLASEDCGNVPSKYRFAIMQSVSRLDLSKKRRRPNSAAVQPRRQDLGKPANTQIYREANRIVNEGSAAEMDTIRSERPDILVPPARTPPLSETTLSKLSAFRFAGPAGSKVQPEIPTHPELEKNDDFCIDDTIFDDFMTEEDDDFEPPSAQPGREISDAYEEPEHLPRERTKEQFSPPPALPPIEFRDEPDRRRMVPPAQAASMRPPAILPTSNSPQVPVAPFMRRNPPAPVKPDSPIPDVTPEGRIQTYFRIGEALRALARPATPPTSSAASTAATSRLSRSNRPNTNSPAMPRPPYQPVSLPKTATIELFAAVVSSTRTAATSTAAATQTFKFADIFFPTRPPYIRGIYTKWTESELFDHDGASIMQAVASSGSSASAGDAVQIQGRGQAQAQAQAQAEAKGQEQGSVLCRAIIRRNATVSEVGCVFQYGGPGGPGDVEILSIFPCDWDDVRYTQGIVMGENAE